MLFYCLLFAAAGFPERLRRAAPLDGGEVQSGRGRVVPRPEQHPPKAQEARGRRERDEGQRGVAGETGPGEEPLRRRNPAGLVFLKS